MISVEQVRALLADRNINAVAAGAGVSPRWLYRFKTGEAKVVAPEDWEALNRYFTDQMREAGFVPQSASTKADPNA
jgi:hypothetical protein